MTLIFHAFADNESVCFHFFFFEFLIGFVDSAIVLEDSRSFHLFVDGDDVEQDEDIFVEISAFVAFLIISVGVVVDSFDEFVAGVYLHAFQFFFQNGGQELGLKLGVQGRESLVIVSFEVALDDFETLEEDLVHVFQIFEVALG